jgi:hypothetical protein
MRSIRVIIFLPLVIFLFRKLGISTGKYCTHQFEGVKLYFSSADTRLTSTVQPNSRYKYLGKSIENYFIQI